jgi:uncharacterized repeat protein (TIGR03803 family)
MKSSIKHLFLASALIAGIGLTLPCPATAQTLKTLHGFTALRSNTNADGAYPEAGLILSGNTLYGAASSGGSSQLGTVFAINTDGTGFKVLHTFSPTTNGTNSDGAQPDAGLNLYGNTLYGTAWHGGSAGSGTVFALNTNGTDFTTLYSFTNGSDGGEPLGELVLSGNTLYGTASFGGNSGWGTVFAVSTNGTDFTTLYSFTNGTDGGVPEAGVIISGSTLYSTTAQAGTTNHGTVFAINTDGTGFTTLHAFTAPDTAGSNSDGAVPLAGLALAGNILYGTASQGGHHGVGTVFAVNTNGTGFTTLHSFTKLNAIFNSDGALPNAGLVLSGATLYGTARLGGDYGAGTVFSVSTSGAGFTTLYSLGHGTNGAWPEAGLTLSGNALYGTTAFGGRANGGTVFSVSSGSINVQHPPQLTISSPKAGQSVSNALLLVTGTVTDKVAVDEVYYQLNGGSWTLATPSNSWSNWTASVTLNPGANTISAYAQDTNGNISPTDTIAFKYIPSAILYVSTNGNGTFTPKDNGALLAIGTNYTLTANAGRHWLFSNWVASGSENFVSNNPVLKFKMQSGLTLTANFVTNVFLEWAVAGTYNGLFAPAIAPRQQSNSGAITFTLKTNGVLSGKLTIGTNTPSLSGQFNPAGAATIITTNHHGESNLITTMQLDFANQTVSGAVSNTDGSFVAQVMADLDVFSATHKATNYEGQYTLIIPGTSDSTVGPYGTSCGTASVSPLGTVTFAWNLADGTSVSPQSSVVSQDGYWPFYVPLYGGNGSLWSWNCFTNTNGAMIVFSTNASWINATNSVKTALYRDGFTNQAASIFGSAYSSTNKPLLALTQGQVILEGGNLPLPITNQIALASNSAITLTAAAENTNKLALTITKTNGVIRGTFVNPSNPRQTNRISGVLLQNQTNAAGYFLGTNQSGTFLLGNP